MSDTEPITNIEEAAAEAKKEERKAAPKKRGRKPKNKKPVEKKESKVEFPWFSKK